MSFLYNILQVVLLIFLLPLMVVMTLFSAKYKERIPQRLGIGLKVPEKTTGRPRIWIHALSVGEATSAKPLIKALRREIPESELFFSSVTQGGQLVAQEMKADVDQFIHFPFDFFFTVKKFIAHIQPDIFVLVETDYWPNIIWQLEKSGVPCVLVNGRIAQKSFGRYRLLRPFFASLLNSFAALSMQMESGVLQLRHLGVLSEKMASYGNLKFDLKLQVEDSPDLSDLTERFKGMLVFVAGSTHEGEERIILESFAQMSKTLENLFLVIAPRNIERAQNVYEMAVGLGFDVGLRNGPIADSARLIILNTLGELVYLYNFADIAFVGGSLVNERGHNPLEPAYWGKPVVYGQYMEDFDEASQGLIEAGAAKQVSTETFSKTIVQLFEKPDLRKKMGNNASNFVIKHQGAAKRCAGLIKKMMDSHAG